MKKHNIIKVVLITILVGLLLTWIIPAAYFSGEVVDQGRIQMGIFDLFNYPATAISYFGYISLYVLAIAVLYGVLSKVEAYSVMVDKLAKKFTSNKALVISVMIALIAIINSVIGVQIVFLVFLPMLVSIIIKMGYDKMVAALTLVGSILVGVAGTTLATQNNSMILSSLSIDLYDEIYIKIIVLVVGIALLIVNTLLYAKTVKPVVKKIKVEDKKVAEAKTVRTEVSTKKPVVKKTATKKPAAKKTTTKKTTTKKSTNLAAAKASDVILAKGGKKPNFIPLVVVFSILFIIMILSFISWMPAFKVDIFDKTLLAITSYEVEGFAIFAKLLGTINAFGNWAVAEFTTVVILSALFIALLYKVKFNDVLDGIVEAGKKAIGPAIVVVMIYVVLVITTYHPFQLTIYNFLLELTSGFNVFTSTVVAFIASILNVEPIYVFQSVLPYFASVVTETEVYPIVGILFQAIYGITMLVAPTSVVLMGILYYLDISYTKWLKTVWKLFVELLCAVIIIVMILVMI